MKKIWYLALIIFFPTSVFSQHIALTHSGTQYDSFENPVQTGFTKELSRKYAITIFPALNALLNFKGGSETAFKNLIFNRTVSGSTFNDIGLGNSNQLYLKNSFYLFTYRIYKTVNYNRELGFALQFKQDGKANISNESFAIFDSYKNFNKTSYLNIFNNKAYNQSYWQLSVNYRENYDEKWGFGGKFSLLNGATYSKMNISNSSLQINSSNSFISSFKGNYISSFGTDSLTYKKLLPNLKNLGLAISGGVSYTSKKGLYLTLNINDLGFIHWNKSTPNYTFDDEITVTNANSANAANRFSNAFGSIINNNLTNKKFNTTIDTKIVLAASKTFNNYKSVFVFSKSTFRSDGQIGLLNNFQKNAFNFGLNTIYDFNSGLNLGSQLLIKSPNSEFYIGSESLFPSYYLAKGYLKKDENIGKNNTKGTFYMGLNVNFGRKMQSMGNADEIPGLNDQETGFVVRLSPKERKQLQKKNKEIGKRRSKTNKRNN
ncbi:DUF5723 family protein [Pedobacter cryophilus]|uniref:DUF5723 domain-containing protein n=1 Tax=Pedobacter cryophilus TaxID=2571271 RepID=A0A4U1C1Z0_9SPHI|nr:DUF5723 family protein [Pedobacter cryophilus]TKB99017.1 hypothetical protein FA046_07850 [Pedobacter cryophilus]